MATKVKPLILHIEDDEHVAGVVRRTLDGAGYLVLTAGTAEAGLRVILHQRPDLVLLDLRVPGMGSDVLLNALSNEDSESIIPVVVLSAFAATLSPKLRMVPSAVLVKPFDPETLLETVRTVLDEN